MADRDLIVDVAILVSHARQRIEDEICEGARVGRLVHLAPREDSAALKRMQPFKKLFAKVWTAYHGVTVKASHIYIIRLAAIWPHSCKRISRGRN